MAAIPPSTATAAFTRLTTANLVFFPLWSARSASTFLSSSAPSARQFFFFARKRVIITKVTERNREESFSQSSDCPVPAEQQPANEYKSLSSSILFSWAAGDITTYASRLLIIGAAFSVFVGWPVAEFSRENDAIRTVIGAVSAGVLFDTLVVLRMYLGWAYVGNRLLSATVEYEETEMELPLVLRLVTLSTLVFHFVIPHIVNLQIWVKPPEVLARDHLLGSYAVKPVLNRVKLTLVLLAAMLVSFVLLFINLENGKIGSYVLSEDAGGRAVPGVYNEDSARSFEPDAFCGVPDRS